MCRVTQKLNWELVSGSEDRLRSPNINMSGHPAMLTVTPIIFWSEFMVVGLFMNMLWSFVA